MKSSVPLESGTGFHGALTSATAKSTYGAASTRIGNRPRASENKRTSDSAAPRLSPSKSLIQDEEEPIVPPVDIGVSGTLLSVPPTPLVGPASTGSEIGASSLTLGPIPFSVQSTSWARSVEHVDGNAADSSTSANASSHFIASTNDYRNKHDSTIPPPEQSTIANVSTKPTPTSGVVTPKALPADETNPDLSALKIADLETAANAVASPILEAQQAVSPALSTAVPGSQPVSTSMVGDTLGVKSITGTTKNAVSPQNAPGTKIKSGAPSPETRSKPAGVEGTATQGERSPGVPASFVRILDISTPVNHSPGVPPTGSDTAALHQVTQASSSIEPTHITDVPQSANGSAEARMQAASGQAYPDSTVMQGVTSAQLTQSMRSSEMKLGMQSPEFGSISISTSLNHQAITAQISIDHSELGKALAIHLPAIEEKLGSAYGVQAKVELRGGNSSSSTNDSGYSNSGQHSRDQRQAEHGRSVATQGFRFEQTASRTTFTSTSMAAGGSRLDIRI